MINIRGTNDKINDDIFYRYKMHKPKLIEQKNNKIFDNINLILKDINREENLLIKFIKSKMGINVISKNNKIILPKHIMLNQIIQCLYEFIEIYVLCPKCKLPETNLIDNNLQCKCCSYNGKLNIQ